MNRLQESFAVGYAGLSAWADLLDRINVFPVADGDTGTNLRISLAPFAHPGPDSATTARRLTLAATGNSGNIAVAFFQEFCQAETFDDLAEKAANGNRRAWQAVCDPCPGTMLNVFDQLATILPEHPAPEPLYPVLRTGIQQAVHDTTQQLPDLQRAGVVDSGALAMYIFFDNFFHHLNYQRQPSTSILDIFAGGLTIADTYSQEEKDCHCVDAVLHTRATSQGCKERLSRLGESVVVVQDEADCKVHIHTSDPAALRSSLDSLGEVVQWSEEKIVTNTHSNARAAGKEPALHIMTDGAGSLPKQLAQLHDITLLDSYIVMGDTARPESLCPPEEVYARMRRGEKLTTAQPSRVERHQYYHTICAQHGPSLYLAVGSVFTGNYETAIAWKKAHDHDDLLTVIDTGAASGRLALIALTTSRYALSAASSEDVVAFAGRAMEDCEEYVFIDELKYLVAGGRLAKASGFFGDLLHLKPVISPTREGAKKVGVVHNRRGQLTFALEKLNKKFSAASRPLLLLQYSDNEQWVRSVAQTRLRELLPQAEIILAPLSLTSGVHMGPGTWSVAFAEVHRETTMSSAS